jgi:hypothetical protein
MIGRLLTALELEIVFWHSDRLRRLGFPANSDACRMDEAFSAFPADWQAVVLSDMQFMLDATREAGIRSALLMQATGVGP